MNPSNFDPDDPRLTSHALGEGTDAEREQVERLLAERPELRAEVEATQEMARGLAGAFDRERALYDEMKPPANVIAFPTAAQRGGWRATARQAWKIAAVLVVLGTVTTMTLRRRPPGRSLAGGDRSLTSAPIAQDETAKVAPKAEPTVAPAVTKNQPALSDGATLPKSVLAPTPAPAALPALEEPPRDLLAMAAPKAAPGDAAVDQLAPSAAGGAQPAPQQQRAFAAMDSARSVDRRPTGGAMPRSKTDAAERARSSSPDAILRQPLVSVRLSDGSYIPGIIVSPDGVVLTGQGVNEDDKVQLTLADGREFIVRPEGGGRDLGETHLQLPAGQYPAASPATAVPHDGMTVVVVLFDQGSGKFDLVRHVVKATGQVMPPELAEGRVEAPFAFDKKGGLLVTDAPALAVRKAAPGAATARGETRSTARKMRAPTAREMAPLR